MSNSTTHPDSERSSTIPNSPAVGYFGVTEFARLNSGFYHDTEHALLVAQLVSQMILAKGWGAKSGHSSERAEFLRQVALIHDADPRECSQSGQSNPGTPARVQVTLAWMESERTSLERRFGWGGFQFLEACALIARTDFPFDTKARRFGTRFDGQSPVELYKEFLWKLPRSIRGKCFRDALILRFADQASAYVGSFSLAYRSVCDLADEMTNLGVNLGADQVLSETPKFLGELGRDIEHDRTIRGDLNLSSTLIPTRRELLGRLGWRRQCCLARNRLFFRLGRKP